MARTLNLPTWLRWTLGIIVTLVLVIVGLGVYYHESTPEGKEGEAADILAEKMLKAIDKTGWDSTGVVQWTFKGVHDFIWDRDRHLAQVKWGETEVLMDLNKIDGRVWVEKKEVHGEAAKTAIEEAWSSWCNDSFWLNAPAKCMDEGTTRSIVTLEDGSEGLKVSYSSGGVTPGDSYLWILDEQGLPTSYKMWVSISPVGGLEFTWEDWTRLSTGARIAQLHKGALNLDISNLKGAANLAEFGLAKDPFAPLFE